MIDLKPYVSAQDNKHFALFGLARSGLSTVKALIASGAEVTAYDDKDSAQEDALKLGAKVSEITQDILQTCNALILAPGVPLTHPKPHAIVEAAKAVNCDIICDIELLYRAYPDATYVGITGTNGKSTTTALVDHVLKSNNIDSQCGGNIGVPAMDLNLPKEGGAFVLELSSYQLDLLDQFKADIAVLLNITPDHLDRHGDMEGYTRSKMRIFDGAKYGLKPKDLIEFKDILKHNEEHSLGPDYPTLPGAHNLENAAAALGICRKLGLKDENIISSLKTFPGLAHRQFLIREINGIKYVNDSKATNMEATSKALSSYEDIYLIAGGRAKEGGLSGIETYKERIRHIFLIGEATKDFARQLEKLDIPYAHCDTLENATHKAHQTAQKAGSGIVLLSPACSSFDQFVSFDRRGDAFVSLVEEL